MVHPRRSVTAFFFLSFFSTNAFLEFVEDLGGDGAITCLADSVLEKVADVLHEQVILQITLKVVRDPVLDDIEHPALVFPVSRLVSVLAFEKNTRERERKREREMRPQADRNLATLFEFEEVLVGFRRR